MPEPRPIVLIAAQVRVALAGGTVELRRKLRMADWLVDDRPIRGAISGMDTTRWLWECLDWSRARPDDEAAPARILGGRWLVPMHSELGATTHRLYPVIRPGARLWVREAWATDAPDLETLRAGLEDAMGPHIRTCGLYYDATAREFDRMSLRARPATTMPRWASRLTLVVTGLRLEPGEARPFVVEARRHD